MKIKLARPLMMLGLTISISACSLLPRYSLDEPEDIQWQSHKQQLKNIDSWNTLGRFAAKGNEDSWSGNFSWQNAKNSYQISISAPLSTGSLQLEGNPEKAILTLENDKQYEASDANSLFSKYTGLRLPINELNFWLLGMPAPNKPIKLIELDQNKRLNKLNQDNWLIEFKRYTQVNGTALPSKIFIENHAFDVRLSLQRWVTHINE